MPGNMTNSTQQFSYKVILIGTASAQQKVTTYLKTEPSIGLDFYNVTHERKNRVSKINMWYTLTQQRYQPLFMPYCRGATAAIICYDETEHSVEQTSALYAQYATHLDPRADKIIVDLASTNRNALINQKPSIRSDVIRPADIGVQAQIRDKILNAVTDQVLAKIDPSFNTAQLFPAGERRVSRSAGLLSWLMRSRAATEISVQPARAQQVADLTKEDEENHSAEGIFAL